MEPPLSAWGISAGLVRLSGGHRNTVFRTDGLAEDLVFKSTRRSPAAVEWLLPVLDEARRSGFVVPELRRTGSGRFVLHGWTCETFVEGRHMDSSEVSELGPGLAVFHGATTGMGQRPGFRSCRDLLIHDRGGDVDFEGMPPNIVRFCREAWKQLSGSPCSVVHGDLNGANLLRTRDGGVAMLDWDECRFDYSTFDAAHCGRSTETVRRALLAWEIACSWWLEPDYARSVAKELVDGGVGRHPQ